MENDEEIALGQKVEFADERVDHSHWVVLSDEVIEALRQQRNLAPISRLQSRLSALNDLGMKSDLACGSAAFGWLRHDGSIRRFIGCTSSYQLELNGVSNSNTSTLLRPPDLARYNA